MHVTRDDESVTIHVALRDADDPAALAEALTELTEATRDLRVLLGFTGARSARWRCEAAFATGAGVLGEQAFFARCVVHAALHAPMLGYVAQLTAATRGIAFGTDGTLYHHDGFAPVGSFAIVPLALADRRDIGALIAHLRGVDLDRETFHVRLVDRLLTVHGIGDETLALLGFRAGDGCGASGQENLWLAAVAHDLHARWGPWGGLDGFAERLRRDATRLAADPEDPDLLVAELCGVGLHLCGHDTALYARWLDQCVRRWHVTLDRAECLEQREGWYPPDRAEAYDEAEWLDWWAGDGEPDDGGA